MLSITNDLERIGDIYYQMSKTIERKDENKIYFLPEQRENLNKMLDMLLIKLLLIMNTNLNSEYGHISN
jgi:phosphate:Na+ symporter